MQQVRASAETVLTRGPSSVLSKETRAVLALEVDPKISPQEFNKTLTGIVAAAKEKMLQGNSAEAQMMMNKVEMLTAQRFNPEIKGLIDQAAELRKSGRSDEALVLLDRAEKLMHKRDALAGVDSAPRAAALVGKAAPVESAPTTPSSLLHMNELQMQEHTKITAEKWRSVAEHGTSKNGHWGEVREISAMKLRQMPFAQGEQGTLEAAQREMQVLMERANAMGFRPDQNESAGAYLERVSREMAEPLTDKQLVDRAATMWNAMGKFITFRGNLNPIPSAAHFITDRVLPGADSTPAGKEFMQVQNVLRRIHDNTGVDPAPGEDARSYAERAIRVQLKKTPTLHADMILEAKKVVTPPTPKVSFPKGERV